MFTLLSWAGRLAWPVLGSLLPGMSPRLIMVLAGVLAALVIAVGPAGLVWLSARGEIKAATDARDLHWQTEISKANEAHAEAIVAAHKAAETVAATPDDRAERLRVCKQSPSCRERGR